MLISPLRSTHIIAATPTMQITDYHNNTWHIIINGEPCCFLPMKLYLCNSLQEINPDTANGLRWRVNRKWNSYRQIKNAIKNNNEKTKVKARP